MDVIVLSKEDTGLPPNGEKEKVMSRENVKQEKNCSLKQNWDQYHEELGN